MIPVIVPIYAAVLTFIYIFLSSRVIQSRIVNRIGLGTGGHRGLERRMRIHANFAEYVPLALLLLVFMEMQDSSARVLHLLCVALVLARIGHAIALWDEKEIAPLRIASVMTTFIVLAVAAITLISHVF
jgi:uncharacterized protein